MTEKKDLLSNPSDQPCPCPVFSRPALLSLWTLSVLFLVILSVDTVFARTINIGILMASDVRMDQVNGLKDALVEHAAEGGHTFIYSLKNAAGDRKKLPGMASEIIAARPDMAVAAGGIEADALLVASKGTAVPVIFLSVSSSVNRGIVASMVSSGNNFTGIDTNDTQLTAKRLWFIRKMLPQAKKVLCFTVPSIHPSAEALTVALQAAPELGFEIQGVEVESQADIAKAVATVSRTTVDVILLLPAEPTDKALRSIIFPKALAETIPIFGYGTNTIQDGAVASYAGSRFANGQQAARFVHKIVNGIAPRDIPIETPEKLEFIINRDLAEKLGLTLSSRVWRMADQIVDIKF
ncbi:MAG: ABC transporter substrate-binding protein [Pseudomonadota bacterium]